MRPVWLTSKRTSVTPENDLHHELAEQQTRVAEWLFWQEEQALSDELLMELAEQSARQAEALQRLLDAG